MKQKQLLRLLKQENKLGKQKLTKKLKKAYENNLKAKSQDIMEKQDRFTKANESLENIKEILHNINIPKDLRQNTNVLKTRSINIITFNETKHRKQYRQHELKKGLYEYTKPKFGMIIKNKGLKKRFSVN
jgi:hypothetical protein